MGRWWYVDGGGLKKKSLMAPRMRRMVEEDWRDSDGEFGQKDTTHDPDQ
jgi:hypothetical protein